MSATDKNNEKVSTDICANCGKGEDVGSYLKACTACKLVKYCNRECQIAHRPQHKKACKKRAKELHDEKLFKQPPPMDDCSICMIRLPTLHTGRTYMMCCGKVICCGCIHAVQSRAYNAGRVEEDDICPFCRASSPKSIEESLNMFEKRAAMGDARAIHNLGCAYNRGKEGMPRNYTKALELWQRAAELGFSQAYHNIACCHDSGNGMELDKKKSLHYFELAASRFNLGCFEEEAGKYDRALKHWMIAVKDGSTDSLEAIKSIYLEGRATKDDYSKALRCYQAYVDEIKSDQRDEAVVDMNEYKYY